MIQEKSVDNLKTFLASAKDNFCTFVDNVDFEARILKFCVLIR